MTTPFCFSQYLLLMEVACKLAWIWWPAAAAWALAAAAIRSHKKSLAQ